MCCGVVPILFGWFLSVPSLHALVFLWKTFLVKWHGRLQRGQAEDGKLCSHLEWPYIAVLTDVAMVFCPIQHILEAL